jgi:2-keto-4-pentenoate hydratase/2-oxohepta-3-ene-1,7-dioic acid hydratase in catechol pathway
MCEETVAWRSEALAKSPEYTPEDPVVQQTDISHLRHNPMKYATFSLVADPAPRLGLVRGDQIVDLTAAFARSWPGAPSTLLALVQSGPDGWERARAADTAGAPSHAISSIRWHAPIPRPSKNVFCLGRNYAAHAREAAQARGQEVKIPTVPVIFTKAPTSVTGPFDDIAVDRTATQQVDWEVELGVVIGVSGRNISKGDAMRHVFGYTVINDLTARDLQQQHMQWFKGKSLDGFCPMGPVLVTADEFGDPQTKRVQLRVNGTTKQDSSTEHMIFPVDVIIEWLSKGLTLEAGDVIATGTPDGVGMGRTPPEFLNDGDVLETEVEGIGVMRNRIKNTSD